MREKLKKIEPYVKWSGDYTVQCVLQLGTSWQIYFDIDYDKYENPFYCFNIEKDEEFWEQVRFDYLYETIMLIDDRFAQEFEDGCEFAKTKELTDHQKEMLLHMLYYLVTDIAYYSLVKNDLSGELTKELNFLLIDILADDNLYLPEVERPYKETEKS